MSGENGGVIGATVTPTTQTAPGVWRPTRIAQQLRDATINGARWPGTAADASYASTTGLWQFNTPASAGGHADTSAVGTNVMLPDGGYLDDTHSKFATYSLKSIGVNNRCAGAGAATAVGFNFGTGDFTAEGWIWATSLATNMVIIDMRNSTEPSIRPLVYFSATGVVNYYLNGAARITSAAGVITTASWLHWHVSKISGVTQLGVAGVQVGSSYTDANTYTQGNCGIGADYTGGALFKGWFGPTRITKGVGRYSGTYTVPTATFPDH